MHIANLKEASRKRLQTVQFQLSDVLGKANYELWRQQENQWLPEGSDRMNSQSMEDFGGSENNLHDIIMIFVIIYLSKPIECSTQERTLR